MLGRVWHDSTTVLRTLLGAFLRGAVRALPWTLAVCTLLAGAAGLLVVWLFSLPLTLPSAGWIVGSREVLAFYFVVGLIGGSSFGIHRGLAELLDAAERESQRLLGPVLDRALAPLPADDLAKDPRELKAALERALSAPLGSGSFLQRQLNRVIAALAADRSSRLLGALGNEPGLSARERLRNALLRCAWAQQRASLAVGSCVIAGLMAVSCAVPPLAICWLAR